MHGRKLSSLLAYFVYVALRNAHPWKPSGQKHWKKFGKNIRKTVKVKKFHSQLQAIFWQVSIFVVSSKPFLNHQRKKMYGFSPNLSNKIFGVWNKIASFSWEKKFGIRNILSRFLPNYLPMFLPTGNLFPSVRWS